MDELGASAAPSLGLVAHIWPWGWTWTPAGTRKWLSHLWGYLSCTPAHSGGLPSPPQQELWTGCHAPAIHNLGTLPLTWSKSQLSRVTLTYRPDHSEPQARPPSAHESPARFTVLPAPSGSGAQAMGSLEYNSFFSQKPGPFTSCHTALGAFLTICFTNLIRWPEA